MLAAIALAAAIGVVSAQPPAGRRAAASSRVVVESGRAGFDSGLQVAAGGPAGAAQTGSPSPDPRSRDARYVPGELIVKFVDTPTVTPDQRDAVLRAGARTIETQPYSDFVVLKLEDGGDPEVVAKEMNARPDVEYAQPNYLRQPLFVPDDPLFNLQWNMMQIDMGRAWDISPAAGESVTVAVIDSGLAFQDTTIEFQADAFTLRGVGFPALGTVTVPFAAAPDLVAPGRIVAPFDFVWMDEFPVDMSGHGSHVTGTLGQLTNNGSGVSGVAFNVQIMPLKVLADEWDFIFGAVPFCCGATDASVAAAIRYAEQFGADVINMSLGGPDPSPVIDAAIEFVVSQGVFVAIAGGNSFTEGNPTTWPAAAAESIDGAMAVAAVDRFSQRAFYSNTGSYVEIAAPGGDQRADGFDGVVQQTLDPEFSLTFTLSPAQFREPRFDVLAFLFLQGTSMASPHVAGLGALLMAQGVRNPAAIEAGIKATATDLGTPGNDDEFGAGLINAGAAVRGLGLAR